MSVSPPLLLYSAAHAEFSDEEPLGGGKTVADYLVRHWQQQQDPGFSLRVLSVQKKFHANATQTTTTSRSRNHSSSAYSLPWAWRYRDR